MKNIKNLLKPLTVILITAVVLVSGGCKKIEYHKLTDEDMAWLVYDNNEVDVFTNGTESRSYHVTIRTKSYNESGDVYNEYTTANFMQMNDSTAYAEDDSKGMLYIYKQEDESLLVTLSWPHFPLKEVPISELPYNIETINGVIYSDVFIIDATGLTDARFYVRKLWYSQTEGLVQYEDATGDVWVRDI